MCDERPSCARNEASTAVSRSLCCGGIRAAYPPGVRSRRLIAGLAAAATALLAGCGGGGSASPPHRFDGAAAMRWVRTQVAYGPRPAGSPASRRLAAKLRAALPAGRYAAVPGGLRNVIGTV